MNKTRTSDNTHAGGCLCGKVRFEADLQAPSFHACHCTMCRSWGGFALAAPVTDIRIEDDSTVRHFSSSEHAQRAFCSACGSHLFWRMKDDSYQAVMIGLLDDSSKLQFEAQLFVDERPAYYCFADDTALMTGEQVMEQFATEDA